MSAPIEEWRAIGPNHDVSNLGRARSWLNNRHGRSSEPRLLNQSTTWNGYSVVSLDGRLRRVHRLVLAAFVGPCPPGMECCHNNGIRGDNRLSNLRWDTRKGNCADMSLHGTRARGERQGGSKLSAEAIQQIRTHRGWLTQKHLAEVFGVHQATISLVMNGEAWRHVT